MSSRWLVLAHVLFLAAVPGCFDSHGMPFTGDAGPPLPDAGMCMTLPGSAMELRCELHGTRGYAILSTAPTRCCSSGTPTTEIAVSSTSTGTAHDVSVEWSACDCCEGCRCIGPIEEIEVDLGALTPGYHYVHAGGLSCTIENFPPMRTCSPGAAEEARYPRHIYEDQTFAATVIAPSGGCGCTPRLDAVTPSSLDLTAVSLCDCCDACDCIDFGYELNVEVDPLTVGEHPVVVPHGAGTVTVVERFATHPMEAPSGVRIASAEEGRTTSGPRIDWAVVTGTEVVCCVPPAPVFNIGVGPDGAILLEVASANLFDCDCIGSPTPYEAFVPLVDLPSGSHDVLAGTATATFVVP